jgi:hypothetical protein
MNKCLSLKTNLYSAEIVEKVSWEIQTEKAPKWAAVVVCTV